MQTRLLPALVHRPQGQTIPYPTCSTAAKQCAVLHTIACIKHGCATVRSSSTAARSDRQFLNSTSMPGQHIMGQTSQTVRRDVLTIDYPDATLTLYGGQWHHANLGGEAAPRQEEGSQVKKPKGDAYTRGQRDDHCRRASELVGPHARNWGETPLHQYVADAAVTGTLAKRRREPEVQPTADCKWGLAAVLYNAMHEGTNNAMLSPPALQGCPGHSSSATVLYHPPAASPLLQGLPTYLYSHSKPYCASSCPCWCWSLLVDEKVK